MYTVLLHESCHEKENKRIQGNVNLTNKENKTFLSFFFFFFFFSFSFFWYQTFNIKLITTLYATHFEEFIPVFTSLYQRMKKLFYTLSYIKQNVLSFSISFDCFVVIHLILCVIPLWDSATAHSPSGKELNHSSHEDTRFFRALHLGIQFSLRLVVSLFGTQQQPTQPPVKSLNFPLWKNHGFLGLLFC